MPIPYTICTSVKNTLSWASPAFLEGGGGAQDRARGRHLTATYTLSAFGRLNQWGGGGAVRFQPIQPVVGGGGCCPLSADSTSGGGGGGGVLSVFGPIPLVNGRCCPLSASAVGVCMYVNKGGGGAITRGGGAITRGGAPLRGGGRHYEGRGAITRGGGGAIQSRRGGGGGAPFSPEGGGGGRHSPLGTPMLVHPCFEFNSL